MPDAAKVLTAPAEMAFTRMFPARSAARYAPRLPARLRDTHDVVVGEDALAAQISQGQDAATAAALHQRPNGARQRNERIGAHVERHPEAFARRFDKWIVELLASRERRPVHKEVEATEPAVQRRRQFRNLFVAGDITRQDERVVEFRRELANVLLEALARIGERDPRACGLGRLGDRPGNRPFVSDTNDETVLAGETGHGSRVIAEATRPALTWSAFCPADRVG